MDGTTLMIEPTVRDDDGEVVGHLLKDAVGTDSLPWLDFLTDQLGRVPAGQTGPAEVMGAALAFLNGVAPADEVEAALGAQMFAVHSAAMDVIRRASVQKDLDAIRVLYGEANKLSRTFTAQVEALAKLRSGGKQQVEVRYVYVDARNSQNVIGNVHGAGGGGRDGNAPQPHAITHAAGVPVWGADPQGFPVPLPASEGAEAMPDARGHEPRRATRPG